MQWKYVNKCFRLLLVHLTLSCVPKYATLKGFRTVILLSHSLQRVCNISVFRCVIPHPRSVIPNYSECLSAACVSVPVQVCAWKRVCAQDREYKRERFKKKKKRQVHSTLLFPFKLSCRVTLNFKSDPFTLKITGVVDQHDGASKGLSKTSTHTPLRFIVWLLPFPLFHLSCPTFKPQRTTA